MNDWYPKPKKSDKYVANEPIEDTNAIIAEFKKSGGKISVLPPADSEDIDNFNKCCSSTDKMLAAKVEFLNKKPKEDDIKTLLKIEKDKIRKKKHAMKERLRRKRPEVKEKIRQYNQSPEYKKKKALKERLRKQKPEVKEMIKQYNQTIYKKTHAEKQDIYRKKIKQLENSILEKLNG